MREMNNGNISYRSIAVLLFTVLLSSCIKETAVPIASSFELTIAVQLLVSFQIYSNISRLSLLARGNSLSLAYFLLQCCSEWWNVQHWKLLCLTRVT